MYAKYDPSSSTKPGVLSEKDKSTTGRVCPEQVNGVCRAITIRESEISFN